MRNFFLLSLIVLIISCKEDSIIVLKKGTWRATLDVLDDKELPFIFEVEHDNKLKIYNDKEVIEVDEVEYRNDSVFVNHQLAPIHLEHDCEAIESFELALQNWAVDQLYR